jgi:hypothetical protein
VIIPPSKQGNHKRFSNKGFIMKFKTILLFIALFGTLNVVVADDTVTTTASTATEVTSTNTVTTEPTVADDTATINVDETIQEIQEAPAEKRVRLMNQFKQRLMQMNATQREDAIARLQEQMHTHIDTHAALTGMEHNHEEHLEDVEHIEHSGIRDHSEEMQMQTTEAMHQMQNNNQIHAGEQYMHENQLPNNEAVETDRTDMFHR